MAEETNDIDKKDLINPNDQATVTPNNDPAQTKGDDEDDLSDEQIAAMQAQIQKKIEDKKSDQKMYTQEDVDNLFKKLEKKLSKGRDDDDEDYIDLLDPNKKMPECVRLGRLKDKDGTYKFVVGLKNINTDPYIDGEITVQSIENPQKKGDMIPWSEFVFEDGTSMLYPYLAFINRSNGVWAEVIERKEEDVSEKFGTIEVKEVDSENEWNMKGTGKRVLAKAHKVKTVYVCKEIKTGRILEVSQDVINKAEAPYSDLKKYLEETK